MTVYVDLPGVLMAARDMSMALSARILSMALSMALSLSMALFMALILSDVTVCCTLQRTEA